MADTTPFVLPDGANISVGGNTLVIRHEGDVILEQTLGRRLVRLESGGDVTLRARRVTGAIRAAGVLRLEGDADCEELRGRVVELGAVEVRARAIVATERVVVRGTRLAVDVIIAPEVTFDAAASGRVRVVDCLNEQASSRVRGCLSLEDYEADFGGVAEFLSRRGVEPVSPLPEPREETGAQSALTSFEEVPPVVEDVEEEEAFEPDAYEATQQMGALRHVDPAEAATVMMTGPYEDDDDDDDDAFLGVVPVEAEAEVHEASFAEEPVAEDGPDVDDADAVVAFEPVIDEDDDDMYVDEVSYHDEPERMDDAADDGGPATEINPVIAVPASADAPAVHLVALAHDDWDGEADELEEIDELEEVVEDETTEGAFQPRRRQAAPSRVEKQVVRACERLVAAYEDTALPAPVQEMQALVAQGRGTEVTEGIDVFWRETLRVHLGTGAPPPRAAILAFHAIRAVAA